MTAHASPRRIHLVIPTFAFVRHLLQCLWGEAGSSMDPLGNH